MKGRTFQYMRGHNFVICSFCVLQLLERRSSPRTGRKYDGRCK